MNLSIELAEDTVKTFMGITNTYHLIYHSILHEGIHVFEDLCTKPLHLDLEYKDPANNNTVKAIDCTIQSKLNMIIGYATKLLTDVDLI